MDEKQAKANWKLATVVLLFAFFIDVGAALVILLSPMSWGWFIFWLVVLTASGLADLIALIVAQASSFGRKYPPSEVALSMGALVLFSVWIGWAAYLVLVATLGPMAIVGGGMVGFFYFLARLLCYCLEE